MALHPEFKIFSIDYGNLKYPIVIEHARQASSLVFAGLVIVQSKAYYKPFSLVGWHWTLAPYNYTRDPDSSPLAHQVNADAHTESSSQYYRPSDVITQKLNTPPCRSNENRNEKAEHWSRTHFYRDKRSLNQILGVRAKHLRSRNS